MSIRRITLDSVFLALLIISSFISIPISDISFTLQVLVILMISLILPLSDALMVIGLYLLMGLIGIPVFSTGGGLWYILKPSFGYLLGFIFVPLIVWLIKKIKMNNIFQDVISSLLGILCIYLFGTIYFMIVMRKVNDIDYSFTKVLMICVVPFIIFDLIKIVVAVVTTNVLKKVINFDRAFKKKISKYEYYKILPSTNTYLKDNYDSLPDKTVCVTYNQTNGKGRMGRSWEIKEGEGLAISFLFKDISNELNIPVLSLVTACSVHKVLHHYLEGLKIKWPNDLIIDDKKIVGILLEGVSSSEGMNAVIVGIGVNINQKEFSPAIIKPTSLSLETGKEYNIKRIEKKIINQLIDDVNDYIAGKFDYKNYLNEYLYKLNERITYKYLDKEYTGTIRGINTEGKLIVTTDDGQEVLYESGEIVIIRK